MGCDIHFVLERRLPGQKWVGVYGTDHLSYDNQPKPKHRDYQFFAEIANVRGRGSKGQEREPKGIPDDVSDLAKIDIDHWDSDGHSHSYMSADEFCQAWIDARKISIGWYTEEFRKKGAEELQKVIEFPSYQLLGYEIYKEEDTDPLTVPEYRVVFWFDN